MDPEAALTAPPPAAAADQFSLGPDPAPASEAPPVLTVEARARLQEMFRHNFVFIWRVLRRLGVPQEDVDDAAQQVFVVAARRIGDVEAGRERAFLFGSALRIASEARRAWVARLPSDQGALEGEVDPAPSPEQLTERKRALEVLDAVLEAMPFELRTVFVLFELEGMSMQDIALALELPRGTVASRLRRAREEFHAIANRVRARAQFVKPVAEPPASSRGGKP
jgi:RNA polymerase sigma-70 factor (ECF subfamily)